MEANKIGIPYLQDDLDNLKPFASQIYAELSRTRDGILNPGEIFSFQLTRANIGDTHPFRVDVVGDGRKVRETFKGSEQEKLVADFLRKNYRRAFSDKKRHEHSYVHKFGEQEFIDTILADMIENSDPIENLFYCGINNAQVSSSIKRIGYETTWYGDHLMGTRRFIKSKSRKPKEKVYLIHYHPYQEDLDSNSVCETVRPSFNDLYHLSTMGVPMIIFTEVRDMSELVGLGENIHFLKYHHMEKNMEKMLMASSVHLVLTPDDIKAYSKRDVTLDSFVGSFILSIPAEKERTFLQITSKPPFYPWQGWNTVMSLKGNLEKEIQS